MKYKHIVISEELHHFINVRKTHLKMTFEEYLTTISTEEAILKPIKKEGTQ